MCVWGREVYVGEGGGKCGGREEVCVGEGGVCRGVCGGREVCVGECVGGGRCV